jgi:hypothetical protein
LRSWLQTFPLASAQAADAIPRGVKYLHASRVLQDLSTMPVGRSQLISLPSIESGFSMAATPLDVRWDSADYPALLLEIEYLVAIGAQCYAVLW